MGCVEYRKCESMGPNYKDWKKSQNKTLDNLYISYGIDESHNNEMSKECDTLGKIAEYGFQNPRIWEM